VQTTVTAFDLNRTQGSHESYKVLKNGEKKFRLVEVLKLAIGPEKVVIFGHCGHEKLIWPAHYLQYIYD